MKTGGIRIKRPGRFLLALTRVGKFRQTPPWIMRDMLGVLQEDIGDVVQGLLDVLASQLRPNNQGCAAE